MLTLTCQRRALHFNFPARTSRGALNEHVAYYLALHDAQRPGLVGWGEAAPLAGLSPDYSPDFEGLVQQFCQQFNQARYQALTLAEAAGLVPSALPALRFALETAVLDLAGGGQRRLYTNDFSRGEAGLPINGLVWMGDAAFMREQIRQKLTAGYACLKVKIGSLDFATELALLAEIRAEAGPEQLMLRVDANGAFTPAEAPAKLRQLSEFAIHSIEQPIAAGQWPALAALCRTSPLAVALDEELIGLVDPGQQEALLDEVRPPYLVLKPTLVGGHAATRRWIALAEARGIGWWITSALESNIGLNAVAQLTGEYALAGFAQGLGTGSSTITTWRPRWPFGPAHCTMTRPAPGSCPTIVPKLRGGLPAVRSLQERAARTKCGQPAQKWQPALANPCTDLETGLTPELYGLE